MERTRKGRCGSVRRHTGECGRYARGGKVDAREEDRGEKLRDRTVMDGDWSSVIVTGLEKEFEERHGSHGGHG